MFLNKNFKIRITKKTMRNTRLLILFIALSLVGTQAFCQTSSQRQPPKGSLTSGPIDSQFIYLSAISRSQDDLKLIRRVNLERVRQNVADSLASLRKQIMAASVSVGEQETKLSLVNDSLSQVRQELEVAQDSKDNFAFLGMAMHKSTYSLIVWGIILALAVILIFYIYRFNQSNVVTRDTKKAIDELQADFDQHRKKAMEKEQKLKRQLQDEINKRLG